MKHKSMSYGAGCGIAGPPSFHTKKAGLKHSLQTAGGHGRAPVLRRKEGKRTKKGKTIKVAKPNGRSCLVCDEGDTEDQIQLFHLRLFLD